VTDTESEIVETAVSYFLALDRSVRCLEKDLRRLVEKLEGERMGAIAKRCLVFNLEQQRYHAVPPNGRPKRKRAKTLQSPPA
jgi:hypothetical protein